MQISSQSLLNNRESSVSAAKRERRKSETFLEIKEIEGMSPPKSPSTLGSPGKRSPDLSTGKGVSTGIGLNGVASRGGERQRRFSVDAGGVEQRPNRRASDTSITSMGSDLMLAESKRRSSSRCSFSGGSPSALTTRARATSNRKGDDSPLRMSRVYSFPEIYDTPMALELDADDDMVRTRDVYMCVYRHHHLLIIL
jgi:hypothetical protein